MIRLTAICCSVISSTLFFSCQQGYEKTGSGLQYKIFRQGSGPMAAAGSTVKLHYTQYLHDSMSFTTNGKLPVYKELIPGTIFPYDPFEALVKDVREGDSVVVVQRMDSLLAKGRITKLSSNLKPSDVMVIGIKVLRVFPFEIARHAYADSLLRADKMHERKKMDSLQTILGPKRVEKYLHEKNIAASRTDQGTYLHIVQPGEGLQADSGKTVLLKFKVSTLHGKVLDGNLDSTFSRKEPLRFVVGTAFMPPSVDRSIRLLKKGGHAIIYIPTMVALGEMPDGSESPAYDDMVFEVIVEDIL